MLRVPVSLFSLLALPSGPMTVYRSFFALRRWIPGLGSMGQKM
jgi:hypothetical protein